MKLILIIFFTYSLSLIQFSFLPAALPLFPIPNLLMIFTIIFTAFEDPNSDEGFFLALVAGLINDFLSPHPFGFYIIIFFAVVYFIKFILKNYVQPSFVRRV